MKLMEKADDYRKNEESVKNLETKKKGKKQRDK